MFINDNDVGTDCEGSAELGEGGDVQAVRERVADFTSSREAERKERRKRRRTGGGSARGGMQEIAAMMRMRKGDSERRGERV